MKKIKSVKFPAPRVFSQHPGSGQGVVVTDSRYIGEAPISIGDRRNVSDLIMSQRERRFNTESKQRSDLSK